MLEGEGFTLSHKVQSARVNLIGGPRGDHTASLNLVSR